jgi:hypothetical protein
MITIADIRLGRYPTSSVKTPASDSRPSAVAATTITPNITIQNSVFPMTFGGIEVRATTLHGVHDAAALERFVEANPMHQALNALLDQLRQQVTGEKDDERAEHGRNHVGQLRECFAQTLDERQGRILGEVLHARNLRDRRSGVSSLSRACDRTTRFDDRKGRSAIPSVSRSRARTSRRRCPVA